MQLVQGSRCVRMPRIIFAASALLASGVALADVGKAGAGAPTLPVASEVLQKMTRQLAQAPGFSVNIVSDYDAIQEDGQSVAFRNKYQISLQRPSQLRIDATRSDGDHDMLLFDGKALTAYKSGENVYAKLDKPGTVDGAVVHMVRDLQMTVPLARMLLSRFPQELEALAPSSRYVERDVLSDVPTDHILVSLPDVDVQLWVTEGEKTLPRKVIISYKQVPGKPQFRAELTEWNLAPSFKPEIFSWTPPTGVEQVPFLAPLPDMPEVDSKAGEPK